MYAWLEAPPDPAQESERLLFARAFYDFQGRESWSVRPDSDTSEALEAWERRRQQAFELFELGVPMLAAVPAWSVPFINATYNSSRLATMLAEMERGQRLLESSLELAREREELRDVWAYRWSVLQLGTMQRVRSDVTHALESLEWAEDLAQLESGELDTQLQAFVFDERLQVYLFLGLPDEGWAAWREQVRAANESEEELSSFNFQLNQLRLSLMSGDGGAAVGLARSFLQRLQGDAPQSVRSSMQHLLGVALASQVGRNPAISAQSAREALELALGGGRLQPIEVVESELRLALLDIEDGAFEAARERLTHADATLGSERRDADGGSLLSVRIDATWARLERMARAPLATRRACLERLESAYADFLAFWERTPLTERGTGFLQYEHRRFVVGELVGLLIELDAENGPRRALQCLVEAQAMGTLARRSGAGAVSVEEFQRELLPAGRGALVYLPAPYQSHVLGVDADGVWHAPLPASHVVFDAQWELAQTVSLWRDPAAAITRAERERLDELRADFIAVGVPERVRRALAQWESVYFVGIDLFGYTPFECLELEGIGLLGRERAIAYLPSIPLGTHYARRPALAEAQLELSLVVAPELRRELPAEWRELEPIPFGARERRVLAGSYREPHISEGERAVSGALLPPREGRARVAQVFAHGVSLEEPQQAVLLLASEGAGDDGLLSSARLEQLYRAAPTQVPDLAILAACGTGFVALRRGEDGVNSLSGTMLDLGARAAVQSYVDLDFEASLRLFEVFHQRLRAGDSPAEALRKARARLLSDARFDHPYFQSLLQVVGLGFAPVF